MTGITPAASQTSTQFPGLPSPQTMTGGVNPGSRVTNPGNAPVTPPQSAWPSGVPGAAAAATNPTQPPTGNAAQPSDSSYQTRYPDLQTPASVPTMPKPGQGSNE
jgi:hypothetical protein